MTLRLMIRLFVLLLTGIGGWTVARMQATSQLAAPPALPALVVTRPGRLTVIRAESAAPVRWHVCPSAKPLDVLPLGDGRELVFVAANPGQYELNAWTASGDMPSECAACIVKVEAEAPPSPPDVFLEQLRAAWLADNDAQKTSRRDLLAGVFRIAAGDTARRPAVRTLGELFAVLKQSSKAVLPDDALNRVRSVISDELRRTLPTEAEAVLDAALRERCAAAFRRVADALTALSS